MMPTRLDDIQPIPELPAWSQELARFGSAPLALCEEFPAIARRFEAWWAGGVLLEVDGIQAIQYTPGAGTPSALAWVDMFRKRYV